MYYAFVPDPNCIRRYKEFATIKDAEEYLKCHQKVFRPVGKSKKCSILAKNSDAVIKTITLA